MVVVTVLDAPVETNEGELLVGREQLQGDRREEVADLGGDELALLRGDELPHAPELLRARKVHLGRLADGEGVELAVDAEAVPVLGGVRTQRGHARLQPLLREGKKPVLIPFQGEQVVLPRSEDEEGVLSAGHRRIRSDDEEKLREVLGHPAENDAERR